MITLKNAGFSYGSEPVLKNMTQEFAPGSFYFLTGSSGAGKSTFLKLCYLALPPTTGEVEVFGRNVQKLSRNQISSVRRQIGVVHQDCAFLDHLSVYENIALPLEVSGKSLKDNLENLHDLLNWVGLTHRKDASPAEISGGERQRLALARAVIMAPEMIVADEPTGNVDWEMATRLLSLLVELNKMGKTILVATHDLNLIRLAKNQVSARVLRLKKGELLVAGAEL